MYLFVVLYMHCSFCCSLLYIVTCIGNYEILLCDVLVGPLTYTRYNGSVRSIMSGSCIFLLNLQ